MPENEAPSRAFYDHEIDEPRATGRRRRQVADWGVGEDVFDRMPSRRFARTERRGEDVREHHRAPRAEDAPPRHDELARTEPRRPRRRPADDWLEEVTPRPAEEPEAAARTIVIGGAVEEEIAAPQDELPFDEPEVAPRDDAPRPRRTIVIGGHPDKLPAPRPRRPPKTALERVGASPDRLAAYAVGLGLLLILIAVLTTGS